VINVRLKKINCVINVIKEINRLTALKISENGCIILQFNS